MAVRPPTPGMVKQCTFDDLRKAFQVLLEIQFKTQLDIARFYSPSSPMTGQPLPPNEAQPVALPPYVKIEDIPPASLMALAGNVGQKVAIALFRQEMDRTAELLGMTRSPKSVCLYPPRGTAPMFVSGWSRMKHKGDPRTVYYQFVRDMEERRKQDAIIDAQAATRKLTTGSSSPSKYSMDNCNPVGFVIAFVLFCGVMSLFGSSV